jgi:hypothetical protein
VHRHLRLEGRVAADEFSPRRRWGAPSPPGSHSVRASFRAGPAGPPTCGACRGTVAGRPAPARSGTKRGGDQVGLATREVMERLAAGRRPRADVVQARTANPMGKDVIGDALDDAGASGRTLRRQLLHRGHLHRQLSPPWCCLKMKHGKLDVAVLRDQARGASRT